MAKITALRGVSDRNNPAPPPEKPKTVKVRIDVTGDERTAALLDERLAELLREVVDLGADEPHPDELRASQTEQAILNAVIPEEVESSPGISSSTSSESAKKNSEPSKPARRKPARTTGNRSPKAQTGSNSASSTAGGPTAPTSDSADE